VQTPQASRVGGAGRADLQAGLRFFRGLPAYLRQPLQAEQAHQRLRRRLEQREATFLGLIRTIAALPSNPYSVLMASAGCSLGDVERLVAAEGTEGALHGLLRAGVYLTVDEFKGRQPVVRGSTSLTVEPSLLRNPASGGSIPADTGASRGVGTAVPMDFAHLADRAVNTMLGMEARGGLAWRKAHWHVPGGGVLARLLEFSKFGRPVERWFSQVDPAAPSLHPRYRWSPKVLRWGSVLAGRPLPRPEHVPLDDPLPIVRWMTGCLRAGQVPHLFTFASSAIRLCQAAHQAGLDLHGAQLTLTGEPLTAARLEVVQRAGAEASARYAVTECGAIGFGCLAPVAPDDVHLLQDLHGLIQPGPDLAVPGVLPDGLLITELRPTSPFLLLNVSMGDRAEVDRRQCGCQLEELGWTTHLQMIRSQEKLTAAGVTFLDTDVVRILEEVLPARFGGGPTDYQLLEVETEDGSPSLRLMVDPAIGPVEPAAVAEAFFSAVGAGGGAEQVAALLWRDAKLLEVVRERPHTTPAGKILHLHQERVRR
jgi:hypothetical protein